MEFSGRVALITGASVGIGRATAMLFAQKGAKTILLDVNFEKLEEVKKEIAEYNNDVLIYKCDVADEKSVNEVVTDAITKYGKIDILVNNAALWRNFEPFEETTTENNAAAIADFIAFYNAETAKIAANGSYSFSRNCEYTAPVDVGGATDVLNGIIGAIDENSNLDTVVGGFLGIGTTKGNIPKDDIKNDYRIKATTLKEADLGSFTAKNGTYTFTLANATNPKKTGATPLSRFTNDFMTHEEVVEGIADFTTAITVNSTTVNYKNIKVTVKVADGKITDMTYSYAFDAQLALKAVVTINGTGAAKLTGTYSAIKY